ncbi:MAG: oligosaccharide flippase family protein [Caulobacteraceae bacterium]
MKSTPSLRPEPVDDDLEPAPVSVGAGEPGGMGGKTAFGIFWFVLQNLSSRATAFLSQIVLAWLLSPADFGLIGLTYVLTSVVSQLVNFGVDDVLVQRQKHVRFWAGSALWVGLGLGLLGAMIVVLLAPLFSRLYHAPGLVGLLGVLAISMPIGTLSTVSTVLLRAQLRFKFLAAYNAVELIAQQAFTIVLAWRGCGAYSFVIPVPIMALARVVVFWIIAKPPLKFRLNKVQGRYLLKSGSAVFGSKLIVSAIGQGDYAILGIFASNATVGAYFFAFRLAAQPVFVLAGNFSSVIYPVLARFKTNLHRQRQAALRSSRLLALIVMPLGFIQAGVAGPLLHTFFGTRWSAAIPLIQILSIGLAFDAPPWIAGALLGARGEFRRNFVYSCLSLPLFFGLVAFGTITAGAMGAALGVATYYLIYGPVYSYAVFRSDGVSLREVLSLYLKPVALSAAALGAGLAASRVAGLLSANGLVGAVVIGAVAAMAYAVLVRSFAPVEFEEVASRVRSVLAEKLPALRGAVRV